MNAATKVGLMLAVVFSAFAYAKRPEPAPIEPLVHEGVRFEFPHWAHETGRAHNGGTVEAHSLEDRHLLWSVQVYSVKYKPFLESDVQDVFIKSVTVQDGMLRIENEKGAVYLLDPKTRSVSPVH